MLSTTGNVNIPSLVVIPLWERDLPSAPFPPMKPTKAQVIWASVPSLGSKAWRIAPLNNTKSIAHSSSLPLRTNITGRNGNASEPPRGQPRDRPKIGVTAPVRPSPRHERRSGIPPTTPRRKRGASHPRNPLRFSGDSRPGRPLESSYLVGIGRLV